MATKTYTSTVVRPIGEHTVWTIAWASLANGDDGTPFAPGDFVDLSVQVVGTFGAGGTIVVEGSNDGVNYATLNNAQGSPISLTAAGLKQVVEACLWIRPRVTAGDGTTALVATLYARRSYR